MATLKQLIESEIGDFFAGFGHPGEPETPEEMQSQLLARVMPLLARMEQEPVAWTDADELRDAKEGACGYLFAVDGKANKFTDPRRMIMLYAAPQLPQPAVPDENGLLPCPFCGSPAEHYPDGDMEGYSVMCGHKNGDCDSWIFGFATPEEAERSWNTRAAMPQGNHRNLSHPVDPQVAAYEKIMEQAVPDELPKDYLQGHKDGLEWAARLAEANHPQTGDWLYDDPLELAKAIRKGPDMPIEPVQGDTLRDGWVAVPVEPTAEMVAAAMLSDDVLFDQGDDTMFRVQHGVIWRAMLAAAPDFREISNSSTKHFRENAEASTKCWCHTCRPVTMTDARFVVCPDCGNKRCPHANDHRNACTGSNEPGQEGSAYPAAPQQEVK